MNSCESCYNYSQNDDTERQTDCSNTNSDTFYSCEECDAKFCTEEAIRKHKLKVENCKNAKILKSKHEKSSSLEELYSCQNCDYRSNLKDDIVTHENRKVQKSLYFCKNCNSKYCTIYSFHHGHRLKIEACKNAEFLQTDDINDDSVNNIRSI